MTIISNKSVNQQCTQTPMIPDIQWNPCTQKGFITNLEAAMATSLSTGRVKYYHFYISVSSLQMTRETTWTDKVQTDAGVPGNISNKIDHVVPNASTPLVKTTAVVGLHFTTWWMTPCHHTTHCLYSTKPL